MSRRISIVWAIVALAMLVPTAAQAAWVWSGEQAEALKGGARVMDDAQASGGKTAGMLWNTSIGGWFKVNSDTVHWIYVGSKGTTCDYVGPKLRVNVWQWRPNANNQYGWEQIVSNKDLTVGTLASGARSADASAVTLPNVGYGYQSFEVKGARAGYPYLYVHIAMLNDFFSSTCDRNAFVDTVWTAGWQ